MFLYEIQSDPRRHRVKFGAGDGCEGDDFFELEKV